MSVMTSARHNRLYRRRRMCEAMKRQDGARPVCTFNLSRDAPAAAAGITLPTSRGPSHSPHDDFDAAHPIASRGRNTGDMGEGSGGGGAGSFLHRSRPYSRSCDGAFAVDSKTGAERSCLQSACYGLAVVFVMGTVAVGIAALVLWLVFRPRVPEFNLQDMQVHSVEVDPLLPGYSSFKVHLSMNSTFVLAVSNRNKVVIRFDPVSLDVLYKDLLLGVAVIPGFQLSARRNTTVRSQFLVESLNVVQAAALDLLGDSLDDHIPLQISGDVRGRLRILGLVTPHMKVQVRCVIVLKPHEMTLDSKECGRQ